ETLGKLLYNKMLETHNKANELEKTDLDAAAQGQVRAARIGAGASPCYPKLDIYHAVNFNIGVKLITSNLEQSNRDLVTQLCKELADYTGEYKTDFLRNMGVRDYNYAAKLFNAEKYEEARAVLEAIPAPPDEEEYNRVLANTYTLIIDKIWENNKDEESETERAANKTKMDALMVKLEKVDSKQHEVMRQRLAQLELIELDKKGKLEEALELAAKDTTTEMNQKNYLSVLVRFSNIKRENKNWDSALSMLDNAVQADWSKTMLNDLRFNTYVDWLDSFKEGDYAAQIDVYKKAFSDAKLDLAGENGQIMSHNYGNALYLKINNLIETRKFKEASAASKAALKEVPEHPELKKQGELIKRIMDRIGG
ncbi:MAG: hypothetical protein QNK37_02105, partial [Acidobacteriota bacterium]|nr:hypothetical protein [Acidobacteriota bacterium]